MEGYGWSGYVANAWSIQRRMTESYDTFRAPLHGWLLGGMGEAMGSYADAAILISSLCVAGMVLSAGLAGRALSGPWAGGLAAAALPLSASTTHAVRWANSYPVLALTTGASLALAVCTARWPRPMLALGTGVLTGLAWVSDGRGLIALPPAMVLIAVASASASGWRRWLIGGGFALGMLAGPGVEARVQWSEARVPSLSKKIGVQRGVVQRWILLSRDDALMAVCGELPESVLLTRDYFSTECPPEMVRYNLTNRLSRHFPLSAGVTLLGIFLLLPGRQGRRGVAMGAGVLLAGAGMGSLCVITPLADRYALQFAVLLSVVGPAGLARLIQTIAPQRMAPVISAAAMVSVAAWVWQSDPTARQQPTALQHNPDKAFNQRVAALVRAEVGPQQPFLDCTNRYIALSMLPRIPQTGFEFLNLPLITVDDAAACLSWIRQPPADDALIAIHTGQALRVGRRGGDRVKLGASLEDNDAWRLVLEEGPVQLWAPAIEPSSPPNPAQ